jgi:hypothetical protein
VIAGVVQLVSGNNGVDHTSKTIVASIFRDVTTDRCRSDHSGSPLKNSPW